MKKALAFALFCFSLSALSQGTDNTVYVKSYPGATVGAKVAAAMMACPSTGVACILVIDPSLAGTPSGTLPTLGTNQYLQDWREGPPATGHGGASYPGCTSDSNGGIHCTGKIATGTNSPSACGSSLGCYASNCSTTQGTPITGQSYIRCDTYLGFVCSFNGNPETSCFYNGAQMYYNQNFDSVTAGSLPSGWGNTGGGTFTVGTNNPVSLPNDLEDPSYHTGAVAVYSGASAVADSSLYFTQKIHLDAGNQGANGGAFLRVDATAQNGYLFAADFYENTVHIFKKIAGAYTQLDMKVTGVPSWIDGDVAIMIVQVQGTALSWKIWKGGTAEPVGWTQQITDTAIATPGYFGIYEGNNNLNNGGDSTTAVDNIEWGGPGAIQ